jgi:hypothetical protein
LLPLSRRGFVRQLREPAKDDVEYRMKYVKEQMESVEGGSDMKAAKASRPGRGLGFAERRS